MGSPISRTSSEVVERENEFKTVVQLLNRYFPNYMLIDGSLLGIVRDENLIPWDWDCEFMFDALPSDPLVYGVTNQQEFFTFIVPGSTTMDVWKEID